MRFFSLRVQASTAADSDASTRNDSLRSMLRNSRIVRDDVSEKRLEGTIIIDVAAAESGKRKAGRPKIREQGRM
jgi:hypothetical protein